ncbi:AAA domain-containing protein [Massilia sp. TWP1-3-3]|uniref:AAA domain-containing protein n=1 Tax=Massilia sp. TWP1-3-3 TaxID=2804573 RepID=UPI003CFBA08E
MTEPLNPTAPAGKSFFDFLATLSDYPQTEDLQGWVLPLFEQVAALHAQNRVAPLEGVAVLRFDYNQLWFENALAREPVLAQSKLDKVDELVTLNVTRRLFADDNLTRDLFASDADAEHAGELPAAPLYLPGYVSWEHSCGHHDGLTDIFVLGLILASVACRLNLSDEADLARFVAHRGNLFALSTRMNPVWARLIVRMTELSRHTREPDLNEVIHSLRNYRLLDLDTDLPLGAAAAPDERTRQLQTHLRDRLFEVSRRNRMLHFKPSQQTLNMTVGSFPLMLDVRNITENALFYWHADLARQVCSETAIPLQKYLRFEDLPFLPAQLDAIRATAQRDQAEYGFSQLRMAVCMFRWHNFKEDKDERITTPLLLLPVTLSRKKGVRDTYLLQATSSVAEVNPVLRHVLRQVYGMELPETIDLDGDALDALHADMERQVRRSEPGITLHKIARPQIQMIRRQARMRLDQYEKRRKKTMSGVARRSHGDFEYSYANGAYHPLGIQLFLDQVEPQPAPLSSIAGKPRAMFMSAPEASDTSEAQLCVAPDYDVIEQQTYAFDQERAGTPYDWEFDLCAITLGNFNYRKMSLVRDYNAVLQDDLPSPSFDGIFALTPRRQFTDAAAPTDLAEQFTVVPQDPTQARAIVRARDGESMIIQGPPGTGKSQTITNLIADFVARGKRVMFVCEKRAAIDVVYHRLQQQGLEQLCALIHDSQGDKKSFVKDLKACYEGWMAPLADPQHYETQRTDLLAQVRLEEALLADFSHRMNDAPPEVGMALRALYKRIAILGVQFELAPGDADALPDYSAWLAHGANFLAIGERLREAGADPVLARHAVRLLGAHVFASDNPAKAARAAATEALPLLGQLHQQLQALPVTLWSSVDRIRRLADYLRAIAPLLQRQLPELLDPQQPRSAAFATLRKTWRKQQEAAAAAAVKSAGWTRRPSAHETAIALVQAGQLETQWYAFVKPAWWQLRALFKSHYSAAPTAVMPRWSDCLQWLQQDYQAQEALAATHAQIESEWQVDDVDAFAAQVEQIHAHNANLSSALIMFQHDVANRAFADTGALLALANLGEAALHAIDAAVSGVGEYGIDQVHAELQAMQEDASWLPLIVANLQTLAAAPPAFAQAARAWPHAGLSLELALARAALGRVYRDDSAFARQTGEQIDQLCARLSSHVRQLHALNAQVILERRRNAFLARVALANKNAAHLDEGGKDFKKRYTEGRREVENEFSKVMRYKAIRELASGESGLVVRDLKPVWMMSPLSISDTLPLETDYFDVVIFDEASQIPVEEAIPSLYRSGQVIIVGDEMQLPPTNFFGGHADPGEIDDEEMLADLSSDSFLTQAARSLPSTMLEWHYRSRSEALITFSNHRFYDGRLLTIPDHALNHPAEPIVVGTDAATAAGPALAQALARPISFHHVPGGLYGERRNAAEAAYIASLVRALLVGGSKLSLGVVAFSEAQQDEIEQALLALARADKAFSTLLDAAYEREEDGQFCGLFIKNLENVQGDERDLIIMSVCYGYDRERKMLMNFGPINRAGGEKRLNVVFSRAKRHMFLVSSIKHTDIKNDYNPGAFALKSYLQFAELSSVGDEAGARQVIDLLGGQRRAQVRPAAHPVVAQVRAALEAHGFLVDSNIGQSGLRCDLGVRKEGDAVYRLGILVDTDSHYETVDLLERYLQQPGLMTGAGWNLERVFSKDWVEAPDAVMARLLLAAGATPDAGPAA